MSMGDDTLDPLNAAEALVKARMEQLEAIAKTVDDAWQMLYGGEHTDDLRTLRTRAKAIADDVLCGRQNFHNANEAYNKLDKELRELQEYVTKISNKPCSANGAYES
jgi:DNA repair ATPase RecN